MSSSLQLACTQGMRTQLCRLIEAVKIMELVSAGINDGHQRLYSSLTVYCSQFLHGTDHLSYYHNIRCMRFWSYTQRTM